MRLRQNPKRTEKVLDSPLSTLKTAGRVSIPTPVAPVAPVSVATPAQPVQKKAGPGRPPKNRALVAAPTSAVTPKPAGPDGVVTPRGRGRPPKLKPVVPATPTAPATKATETTSKSQVKSEDEMETQVIIKTEVSDAETTEDEEATQVIVPEPENIEIDAPNADASSKKGNSTASVVPPKATATVTTTVTPAKVVSPADSTSTSKSKPTSKSSVTKSDSEKESQEKVKDSNVEKEATESSSKTNKSDEPSAPKGSQSPVRSTGVTLRGSKAASSKADKSELKAATANEAETTSKASESEKDKSSTSASKADAAAMEEDTQEISPIESAATAESDVADVDSSATLKENKQLVLKIDKLVPETSAPLLPKRSERVSTVMKRKLSEDPPEKPPVKTGTGKRGRPPKQAKAQPTSSKDSDKNSKDPDYKPPGAQDRETRLRGKDRDRDADTGISNQKENKDKDKDERSFERFYAKIKDTSVVSERWSFGGVLWDPTKKMKVMAASEVDVTSNGNMRLRRCVQVFENYKVRVMVEGADMTKTFSTTGEVSNANEVTQLIHKVATSKICTGIKNFGTTDKIYFPHCVLRGESYFAPECPIVIDYGVVGPLCQHCNRLRNMIHRRNIKETNLLYSKFSRAPVKNIRSGFGKQLYSMLTDLVEASSVDAKKERKKLRRMIPSNAKEYPFRSDTSKMNTSLIEGLTLEENQQIQMQQQQQLQIQLAQQQIQMHQQQQMQQYIKSDASGNITISSIPGNTTIVNPATGSSDYIRLAKPYMGQNSGEMMTFNVMSGQRGSFKVSGDGRQITSVSTTGGNYTTTFTNSGGTVLTPSEMHMVEQLCLQEGHDAGNIIIQNSGDFTLAEGQEYELIGEADSDNPIQVLEVLKEENQSNNTIEIIEVDDQTLAQLTSQNLSNFIIQEPSSGFEVQEIDANDPNFRHLVKALNPGTVMYQS